MESAHQPGQGMWHGFHKGSDLSYITLPLADKAGNQAIPN